MIAALVLLLLASSASAHIVPVPPSTCTFDPAVIEAPASGVVGTAAPPGAADQFRILYDPQASQAEFDMESLPPRAFTAGGVAGTFALPAITLATLRDSGDLTMSTSLLFTMGGSPVSVPMALTSGVAAVAGTVIEGVPVSKVDGRFELVGITPTSALGPPLGGQVLAVRLACQASPPPDTDQFRLATRTTPLSAALTARILKLRAIFAPGVMDVANFPGAPAVLRVASGGTTITTVDLVSGLPAHGRKLFIGRSDDGRAALGVRQLQRSGQVAFLLALKIKSPALPVASSGPVTVTFTYDFGGLLSHLSLPMRVKKQGALLRYP